MLTRLLYIPEGGEGATVTSDLPDTGSNNASQDTGDNDSSSDSIDKTTLEAAESSGVEKQPISKVKSASIEKKEKNKPTAEDLVGDIESLDDLEDKGITKEDLIKKSQRELRDEKEKQQKAITENKGKETQQQTQTSNQTGQQKDGQRDYSWAPAELHSIFKKTPNDVFNWLKDNFPKFKQQESELAELRKGIPASYYEHPQAYQLSDSYNKAVSNYRMASVEEAHWIEQAKLVSEGKPWRDIEGYDKNGRMVLSKQQYPGDTFEGKDAVNSGLQAARQHKEKFMAEVTNSQQNHITEYKKIVDGVREGMVTYFPWIKDSAMFAKEYEVINPADGKTIKTKIPDLIKQGINYIHPALRGSPVAEIVGNMYALLTIQNTKLKTYERLVNIDKTNKKQQEDAEPVGQSRASGATRKSAASKDVIEDVDDMKD